MSRKTKEPVRYASFEDLKQIEQLYSMSPIILDFCGREQCRSNYTFGPFVRTGYVLHMVIGGRGRLMKKEGKYDIHAGQAFLLFPGEETVYRADAADPWNYMWIGFHGFKADEMVRRAGFTEELPVIDCPDMDALERYMDEMLQSSELTYVNELQRFSSLFGLFAILSRSGEARELTGTSAGDLNHEYVRTAVNLLMGSYAKQIRVADVAKTIGISRNYLDSIFKKEMGLSPREFLTKYRMDKAASLLLTTSNPVGVIAAEVGYSDPMTFSKMFRSKYGMSPTAYRAGRTPRGGRMPEDAGKIDQKFRENTQK